MRDPREPRRLWRYARGLAAPVLLWALFVAVLAWTYRQRGDADYDRAAIREWVEEAVVFRRPLQALLHDYLTCTDPDKRPFKARAVQMHLQVLGDEAKTGQGKLPLFPTVYRLALEFAPPQPETLAWDSDVPRRADQVTHLPVRVYDRAGQTATLHVEYVLHAYDTRQRDAQEADQRLRRVSLLAAAATALALLWIYLVQKRERERAAQRALALQKLEQAERLRLEEELRRQEAERRHEEAERKLLEQRLATQAAEGKALELKSQLYAGIGIMAGSYAHNIKNLLVRPNDLLSRCLEADGLATDQAHMLHEVRATLGTVTERLQQILRTVRRDPSRSERTRLDLNEVAQGLRHTWEELAREKWKLTLQVEAVPGPLWVEGDLSHLQQAAENLLFNARDATFEMRNHLRDQARRAEGLSAEGRRQSLIAAAAWKGTVTVRTSVQAGRATLEVQDNGIGMTEEIRRRCTETHFSTKRDNAIYEGISTGMGLGLSFVVSILEHHGATLEIESQRLAGALFRIRFPAPS